MNENYCINYIFLINGNNSLMQRPVYSEIILYHFHFDLKKVEFNLK